MYEVVNNATHRFMLMEAHSKGLINNPNSKALKGKCAVIRQLTDYWQKTVRLLSLNLLLIGLDEPMVRAAEMERQQGCLLTNDSMIISCMRNWGIAMLATNDSDFEAVAGITVYKPNDVLV